tara:strand:- start:555 stop:1070 length:516 start_codon:yes stop_codon:yes gene_type:complete
MLIEITDKMKDYAKQCEETVLSTMIGTNYTGLNEPNKFYYGYIGEFAFIKWLKQSKIKHKYSYKVHPGAYRGAEDFVLYANNGQQITVDVKTATKPHYKNIMMPKSQAERYTYNCYVGVLLVNDDIAKICGYCQKNDFTLSELMYKIPTYYKPLNELNDMQRLSNGVIKLK